MGGGYRQHDDFDVRRNVERHRDQARTLCIPCRPLDRVEGEADRSSLDEAYEIAEERGIEARTKLLAGDAAKQIVAYADEVYADLVIVGSRGLGMVSGVLLGSVSRAVLRDAKRPVLIVREVHSAEEVVA